MEFMNGPAQFPCALVTAEVSWLREAGSFPCGHHRPDRRGEGPGVGLRLRDAAAGQHVRVERDRDRGQNADDGHDDHQLDECEAALRAGSPPGHALDMSKREAIGRYPVSS